MFRHLPVRNDIFLMEQLRSGESVDERRWNHNLNSSRGRRHRSNQQSSCKLANVILHTRPTKIQTTIIGSGNNPVASSPRQRSRPKQQEKSYLLLPVTCCLEKEAARTGPMHLAVWCSKFDIIPRLRRNTATIPSWLLSKTSDV